MDPLQSAHRVRNRTVRTWSHLDQRRRPRYASRQTDSELCNDCLHMCAKTIHRVGKLHSLRSVDLDDYVQDAWLAVLSSLSNGQFDPSRGQPADWLHVVARNRAISFYRRRWRNQCGLVEVPLDLLQCRLAEDPVIALARAGEIERVRRALAILKQQISSTCYAVLQLRHIEQISVRDAATTLGLSHEQVRVYAHRARQKLALIMTGGAEQDVG